MSSSLYPVFKKIEIILLGEFFLHVKQFLEKSY